MAKKKEELDFDEIYGELVEELSDKTEFIPSGSLVVDAVLSNGKGIPMGKFIEIASDSGIGKSTMMLHISRHLCELGHRVIYLDTERGLNMSQVESFSLKEHMDSRLFIPVKLSTFGEIDEFLRKVLQDPLVKIVVLDSITATLPQRLMDKNVDECNEPGIHARSLALFMQKFHPLFEDAGKSLLIVNQTRTKISFVRTTVEAAGGKGLQFFGDIRLQMRQVSRLSRKVEGYENPIPYGADNLIWSNKNRFCAPFVPLPIAMYFGKGISNTEAIIKALQASKVIETKGSWFNIERDDGEKASSQGRERLVEHVRENLSYYKEMVDARGGIYLTSPSNFKDNAEVSEVVVEDAYDGYVLTD